MMNDLLEKFNACLRAKYTHIENDGSYAATREGDKLTLYFEPSNGVTDWKNNFDFPVKPYREMDNLWFCHRGFLKVWKSIEPYIENDIKDLGVKKIDIIGYSHGGAIAQLCYEYVKFNRPDVEVTGVGFGSPRVLWGFAKKAVKERFAGFKIIRNGRDIVTYLPPLLFGFRHICEVVKIGGRKNYLETIMKEAEKYNILRKKIWGVIVAFVFYVIIPIYDHYPSKYRNALKEKDNEQR